MSANRSVQAAQRRRSGPVETVSTRGPQPSINSSQMFANQARTPQRQSRQQSENNIGNIGKMTLPQAITLITLRLGSLESKLMNMNEMTSSGLNMSQGMNEENMALIDQGIIDSIASRLESLEKRSTSTSSPEVNLITDCP